MVVDVVRGVAIVDVAVEVANGEAVGTPCLALEVVANKRNCQTGRWSRIKEVVGRKINAGD